MGARAVAIKILKKRPYTVSIMTRDSAQIKRLPKSVTIQRGMLSQKPTLVIASITVCGRSVAISGVRPEYDIMVDIAPCAISKTISKISMQKVIAASAKAKRMKSFKAAYCFHDSHDEKQH